MSKSIYEWLVVYDDNTVEVVEATTLDNIVYSDIDTENAIYIIRKDLA